jgi:hypothetical protein
LYTEPLIQLTCAEAPIAPDTVSRELSAPSHPLYGLRVQAAQKRGGLNITQKWLICHAAPSVPENASKSAKYTKNHSFCELFIYVLKSVAALSKGFGFKI